MKNAIRVPAAGSQPSSMEKLPGTFLRVALTAVLLWLAFRHADWSRIGAGLAHMQAIWFASAIVVLAFQLGLAAQRWRWIALGCGATVSTASALRYIFISQFFSQTLPATIGADGARIWYLGRDTGDWKPAFYSVFIDRGIGGLALGILVVAILPGAFSKIQDPAGRLSLLIAGSSCLVALAAVMMIGSLPWLDRWAATRHVRTIAVTGGKLFGDSATAAKITITSIAIHLFSVLAIWCIAQALTAPLTATGAIFLVPPVMLITMVPISVAGWGVRESAMIAALGYAGIGNSQGLLISLLFGAAGFVLGLAGGGVWIAQRRKD
jgi:uncharacterized membrane protein YbhN (UPF0104 family)